MKERPKEIAFVLSVDIRTFPAEKPKPGFAPGNKHKVGSGKDKHTIHVMSTGTVQADVELSKIFATAFGETLTTAANVHTKR